VINFHEIHDTKLLKPPECAHSIGGHDGQKILNLEFLLFFKPSSYRISPFIGQHFCTNVYTKSHVNCCSNAQL